MKLEKRIDLLEKRVAELEGQVQGQPTDSKKLSEKFTNLLQKSFSDFQKSYIKIWRRNTGIINGRVRRDSMYASISNGNKVLKDKDIKQVLSEILKVFSEYELNYSTSDYILELAKHELGQKSFIKA